MHQSENVIRAEELRQSGVTDHLEVRQYQESVKLTID